jgi:tryptophan 2,3-dioxygenase
MFFPSGDQIPPPAPVEMLVSWRGSPTSAPAVVSKSRLQICAGSVAFELKMMRFPSGEKRGAILFLVLRVQTTRFAAGGGHNPEPRLARILREIHFHGGEHHPLAVGDGTGSLMRFSAIMSSKVKGRLPAGAVVVGVCASTEVVSARRCDEKRPDHRHRHAETEAGRVQNQSFATLTPMECPFSGERKPEYYGDYLAIDELLQLQRPLSLTKGNLLAHDEMLFIVIHQAYELWFKQIRHELTACSEVLSKPAADDDGPDMNVVVHRLKRIVEIWKLLNHQVDVLETMTPLDFLEFRDHLHGASGFQSKQFARSKPRLGLQMANRFRPEYYKHTELGGFNEKDFAEISEFEKEPSLLRWSSVGSRARRSSMSHSGVNGNTRRLPRAPMVSRRFGRAIAASSPPASRSAMTRPT